MEELKSLPEPVEETKPEIGQGARQETVFGQQGLSDDDIACIAPDLKRDLTEGLIKNPTEDLNKDPSGDVNKDPAGGLNKDPAEGLNKDLNEDLDKDLEGEQAKSRADRAWREFRSVLYTRWELDNSIFAGPGHAELTTSLGHLRLFRTTRQSSPVISTLLKLNLLLCAIVVFFFTFQVASNHSPHNNTFLSLEAVVLLLPVVLGATVGLAFLTGLLWLSQRPQRLKILPNMLVLRTDLNETFFSELLIPWPTIQKIEITHKKLLGAAEIETMAEISTALGVKHFIPLDDLLVDNTEASFVNAVRTWAPWAAQQLSFKRSADHPLSNQGARLTELWLHQFNTTQTRKESGMLAPGTELTGEGGGGVLHTYTVLGILGGGGQGNTYLASVTSSSAHIEDSPQVSTGAAPSGDSSTASSAGSSVFPNHVSSDLSNALSTDVSTCVFSDLASDVSNYVFSDGSSASPHYVSSDVSSDVSSYISGDVSRDVASHAPGADSNQVAIDASGEATTTASAPAPLEATEVVLKEYILPMYRGSTVLAKLSEKLADEANLLARLDHPLVVKVSDHFVSDYRGYLVLEYVEGRSLKELVAREGPQPESFVVEVAAKLLDVLGYMHGFCPPIVHRDLSPDNVMLSVTGEIKVVDFNVARQLEGSVGSTVVGKHAYIPPEQFRGRAAPASDIYALGGTLHFLLTGQDPDPLSVSHPRESNAKVSVALDQIVARATCLDLADRYAAAAEMLADLSRVMA